MKILSENYEINWLILLMKMLPEDDVRSKELDLPPQPPQIWPPPSPNKIN